MGVCLSCRFLSRGPQQSMMNLMRSAATLGGVWTRCVDGVSMDGGFSRQTSPSYNKKQL